MQDLLILTLYGWRDPADYMPYIYLDAHQPFLCEHKIQ